MTKLSFRNRADAWTLTSDRAWLASLPLAHLQSPLRGKIARTTAAHGSVWIQASSSEPALIGCVALTGLPAADATYTVEAGAYSASLDVVGSSDIVSVVWWFDPVLVSSVKVTGTLAAGTQVWEASRLWVGDVWAPERAADVDAEMVMADASVLQRMESGSLRRRVGAQWSKARFGFSGLTEGERGTLWTALRGVGKGEVLVSLWAGAGGSRERDHQILGRITSEVGISLKTWERFGARLEVDGS